MPIRERVSHPFASQELTKIKNKVLNWVNQFSTFSFLDNNEYRHGPNRQELLAAAGIKKTYAEPPGSNEDWLFGHVAYDYKECLDPRLNSRHHYTAGFQRSFFYCPQVVISIPFGKSELTIEAHDPETVLGEILSLDASIPELPAAPIEWHFTKSKSEYLADVMKIQQHIIDGDCYELNFCVEAQAVHKGLSPISAFSRLRQINPSPFAAFYRHGSDYLISASPERFLFKQGLNIVSQPIKGTIRRVGDPQLDELQKQQLYKDKKERAENVMIVDLVRNDLAQCSELGSVVVDELFGIYSFPQLHHMISTISGKMKPGQHLKEVLEVTFPMGSMTGAPKRIVMELIDTYESSRRGLYSGSVGYISPDGDFDFNVVIRSLVYNSETGRLSYHTGGAITYHSDPEREWEEVQLKAKAMRELFG